MRRVLLSVAATCLLVSVAPAATPWVEGQHFFAVRPAQATNVPRGKVEVVEVFSYACPACNVYYPVIDRLKAALPPYAQLRYLPASWHPEEDWKTFQRAFFAAQALGLVERTHAAVFDAVWKSGELATMDKASGRPKTMMPTIADCARFYAARTGATPEVFLAAAQSFSVDANMRQADNQIRAYQADQTPTLIVNGKYRVTPASAGGNDQLISLVKWLVERENTHQ